MFMAYCEIFNIKKLLQTPNKHPLANSNSVEELSVGKTTCGPDETECPDACCPVANWFCCPNGRYCAETPDKCPLANSNSMKELSEAKTSCGPDETECPDACCPVANWYCCPFGKYCAETLDKCPLIKSNSFKELSVIKSTCGPEETECPGGCCILTNAYCCPDGIHCAPSPDKCPHSKYDSFKELSIIKPACPLARFHFETECPGGCCILPNAYCCPDGIHCAPGPPMCPQSKSNSFMELSVSKPTCGPGETQCPDACCPVANWFCCPDGRYCAETPDKCPLSKSNSFKKLSVIKSTCGPEETECPGGCCTLPNAYCCPNGINCAHAPHLCPPSKSNSSKELSEAKFTCDPDETKCPGGCCKEANWECCLENPWFVCAPTFEACPFSRTQSEIKFNLVK